MAVSGFVVNCLELIVQFIDSIAGAIIAYCGIQSLRVWQIHRHSQSNIGYGDAKYFGALGAWLGYQAIAPLLVGASLLMLLLYLRRDEKPFGVGLGVTALGLFGMRLAGE